jgi:hypothetical protein
MASIPRMTKLVDAQAMARRYPDTFEAPTDAELLTIEPRGFVKVSRCGERFWCQVIGGGGKYVIAHIANALVKDDNQDINDHRLFFRIELRHIYDVMPPMGNSTQH